jgi:hypothetical protein
MSLDPSSNPSTDQEKGQRIRESLKEHKLTLDSSSRDQERFSESFREGTVLLNFFNAKNFDKQDDIARLNKALNLPASQEFGITTTNALAEKYGNSSISYTQLQDLIKDIPQEIIIKPQPLDTPKPIPNLNPAVQDEKVEQKRIGSFVFSGDVVETEWGRFSLTAIQDWLQKHSKNGNPVRVDAQRYMEILAGHNADPRLAFAQGLIESHYGTNGERSKATKNIYNVYNRDDGHNHHNPSWEAGIDLYAKYITKHYGDLQDFVKLNGYREDGIGAYCEKFQGKTGRSASIAYTNWIAKKASEIEKKISASS